MKAGWEVEGFIDRLTRRNDHNSERLVLEAISHLRAFSDQDTTLRDRIACQEAEIERLRAALRGIAEFCSGDDSTLGAIGRLASIRNTAERALNEQASPESGQ